MNDAGDQSTAGRPPTGRAVAVLLGGAVLLHGLLLPSSGWERDLYWFGTWMRVAIERGVAYVADAVWCDYPPGYLYLLKGVGLLWMTISGGALPADGTTMMLVLLKLIPTAADVAGAWALYRLAVASGAGRTQSLLVLAAYAYNPALLVNSAIWGQADSLVAVLLLLAVWAVGSGRSATGFAIATATVLIKLQAVVVVPALLLVTIRSGGAPAFFAAWRGGALAGLAVCLPFFAANRMEQLIGTIFGASGRYPFISMNAHNLWWLVGGVRSTAISDVMRIGNGLLTYRTLGGILMATAMGLVLWRLWRDLYRRGREPLPALVEACALQLLAFYLFPTEMHERYIVPALVFLAAACIWRGAAWWPYLVCSAAVLLSLAGTLNANYPQALGAAGALLPASRAETQWLSVVFIGLFVVLLLWTADRRFKQAVPLVVMLVGLLIAAAAMAPVHAPQRLSEWDPVEQSQQWGSLRRDRSVDGNRLAAFSFIFRHGIGTHAASRLKYHLNGAFRTFDTAFALDDEGNRGQRIRFRILADDQVRFDSGELSGHTAPHHARVPVDGAQFLTLEVLDGGDGINSDHADWLEPVLLR